MSNTTNDLGISQNGIPIFNNLTGTFTNTIPPANQLLVGDANSQIIGVDPTGFAIGTPICSTGVGIAPNFSTNPTVNSITIQNLPMNSTDGANKSYVDSVATGISFLDSTQLATTAALTAVYNNGVAGVGATLTNSGAQTALVIDSVACVLGNRILVKDQAAQEENGVYEVTDVGSVATNWELTRTTDYDQAAEIIAGSIVSVLYGTVNHQTFWAETQNVANIGTDPIIFIPFNSVPNNVLISTNNLSDVANAATSRSNLGLTAIATQTPTQYAVQVGGAANSLVSLPLGTAGQVLTSNGAGVDPSFQNVTGGSGFTQIVTQVFTGSGTYTPTANMKYCIVEIVGGGGGGGASSKTSGTNVSGGGGGGAGGYARKVFSSVTIGASQAVTIGAGGTAGAVSGGTGGTGGTSSFGALLQATGGGGGQGSGNGVGALALGGNGGQGSLGDINLAGAPGCNSWGYGTTGFIQVSSGNGGGSFYGAGGKQNVAYFNQDAAGNPGKNYGSGGSGAVCAGSNTSSARAGGAGSAGLCVITEYI